MFSGSARRVSKVNAGIVELVSSSGPQEALFDCKVLYLLTGIQYRLMGWQQAVVEPLDHHHGQDHQAVLMGFECTKEGVCHIPNESGLLLDIPATEANCSFAVIISPFLFVAYILT